MPNQSASGQATRPVGSGNSSAQRVRHLAPISTRRWPQLVDLGEGRRVAAADVLVQDDEQQVASAGPADVVGAGAPADPVQQDTVDVHRLDGRRPRLGSQMTRTRIQSRK
jgi:hypothetical protein